MLMSRVKPHAKTARATSSQTRGRRRARSASGTSSGSTIKIRVKRAPKESRASKTAALLKRSSTLKTAIGEVRQDRGVYIANSRACNDRPFLTVLAQSRRRRQKSTSARSPVLASAARPSWTGDDLPNSATATAPKATRAPCAQVVR